MKNVFARNPDGSIKHKKGCADCEHPNWHVCPNRMGPDTFGQLLRRTPRRDPRNDWSVIREVNKELFAEIVRLYEVEEFGIMELAAKFRFSGTKITRILTDAEEERGERIRRLPGQSLRNYAGLTG